MVWTASNILDRKSCWRATRLLAIDCTSLPGSLPARTDGRAKIGRMNSNHKPTRSLAAFIAVIAFCSAPLQVGYGETSPATKPAVSPHSPSKNTAEQGRKAAPDSKAVVPQAGIGAALRIESGKVLVAKVLPDTPAALSNSIHPDDQIVAVAEAGQKPVVVTGEKELARVVGLVRGPVKSVVRLTIIPKGKSEADSVVVSLVRDNIKQIDQFVDGRLLAPGTKAPDFKFTRLSDSQEASFAQLRGKVVVIEFCASWCGPCLKSLDELNSLRAKHREWEGRVELLAISVDETQEEAAAIAKAVDLPHMSVGWAGPAVQQQYRVGSLPTVFIVDQQGNVVAADHRLDTAAIVSALLAKSAK